MSKNCNPPGINECYHKSGNFNTILTKINTTANTVLNATPSKAIINGCETMTFSVSESMCLGAAMHIGARVSIWVCMCMGIVDMFVYAHGYKHICMGEWRHNTVYMYVCTFMCV